MVSESTVSQIASFSANPESTIIDALNKILGITPAFIRPRTSIPSSRESESYHRTLVSNLLSAYGSYNDLVLGAAAYRGQTVVTWDFEYVGRCSSFLAPRI